MCSDHHSLRTEDVQCLDSQSVCHSVNSFLNGYQKHLCYNYTVFPKNVPLCDCLYLRQKSINYQNSFTGAFCGELAIKWLLNIPPHVNCVTTLPCEIQMQEKLTIIDSKRVGEQNTILTKNAVRYYTLLDPFLWISGVLHNM